MGTQWGRTVLLVKDPAGPENADLVGRQRGSQPFAVFYVDDLTKAVDTARAAGAVVSREQSGDHTGQWVHVRDLYGNENVLVELGPRGALDETASETA